MRHAATLHTVAEQGIALRESNLMRPSCRPPLPAASSEALANATTTSASVTVMPSEPLHSSGLRPMRSISTTVTRQAPMLSAPDITLMSCASFSEKPTACHSTAP